jgi:phage-related minor tail protein
MQYCITLPKIPLAETMVSESSMSQDQAVAKRISLTVEEFKKGSYDSVNFQGALRHCIRMVLFY